MTPTDFLRLLETALRGRHVSYCPAVLLAFVESAWPLIEDDPDPFYWCERFLEGMDVLTPA
jgi:hypothetical protein